jgi:hypothetical protein
MPDNRSLKITAAVAASFTALVLLVLGLAGARVISFQLALLMCTALVGLYVGFGFLVLVARMVSKLR